MTPSTLITLGSIPFGLLNQAEWISLSRIVSASTSSIKDGSIQSIGTSSRPLFSRRYWSFSSSSSAISPSSWLKSDGSGSAPFFIIGTIFSSVHHEWISSLLVIILSRDMRNASRELSKRITKSFRIKSAKLVWALVKSKPSISSPKVSKNFSRLVTYVAGL